MERVSMQPNGFLESLHIINYIPQYLNINIVSNVFNN